MANPVLYHNNALLRAHEGLGDGTVYATATSAGPDQANKRFTLTGLAIIADLGADSDDKFNGFILYFPASDTRYLITDWEAGTDRVTVDDVPATTDTGACEIRRALYAPDMYAAFPLHRAVNGFPSIKAKVRAANVALNIDAHLPNLVGQGGFEELPATDLPESYPGVGKWWAGIGIDIYSAAVLLGSRMAQWTVSTGNQDLLQRLPKALQKGKTYRLIAKVQAVTAATNTDVLRVTLKHFYGQAHLDADWGGAGVWNPGVIGTAAAWITSPDFIPDSDTDTGQLTFSFVAANAGSASAVRLDEVYLWEVVPVAALLAFQHNWDGSPGVTIYGDRCSSSRTGFTGDDQSVLASLGATAGSGPLRAEFAAGIFPIYRFKIDANASFQYEVGELLLGEKWAWLSHPQQGMEPQAREYRRKNVDAISGARTSSLYFERRELKGRIRNAKAADVTIWDGVFRERHVKLRAPFALYWPGHLDTPRLMTCERLQIPYNTAVRPDVDFEFIEAL